MSLGERVKKVRKARDLTQQQFAERLGMKRNSIAQVEGGRSTSDQTVFAICREFKVNEHWLRTGEGEMFIKPDTFSLDEYAKERGASELEIGIVKVYFSLPPAVRAEMMADLKELVLSLDQNAGTPTAPPMMKLAAVKPPADADRAMIEQEADEFAAIAREQFIQEKKRESGVLSAKSSDAG